MKVNPPASAQSLDETRMTSKYLLVNLDNG